MEDSNRRQELVFSIFMVALVVLGREHASFESMPLLWACAALLLFNLGLHLALRGREWTTQAALVSVGGNLELAALVVALSGGPESRFWPLFLLPAFTACLHLEGRHIVVVAAAAAAFLGCFYIEPLWSGQPAELAEWLAKVGVIAIAASVTGRVSLSERRQRGELRDSRLRLEELATRLERRELRDAQVLLHSLNNSLTVILGSVQLTRFELRRAGPQEDLDRIERAARRCRELSASMRGLLADPAERPS